MSKKVDSRFEKVAGPPNGVAWIWHTLDLRSSPAWKTRSPHCARLLEILELEYMHHAGRENGYLKQTFNQIVAEGIPRKFISAAIWEGENLGLLEARRGARKSRAESHMTMFRLTYLPSRNVNSEGGAYFVAPTDEWKRTTAEHAASTAHYAISQRVAASVGRQKNKIRCPEREPSQYPNGNRANSQIGTASAESGGNAGLEKPEPVPEPEPLYISWVCPAKGGQPAQAGTVSSESAAA